MAGETNRFWDPLVMQQELTQQEKQLRDRFITEYLKDFNPYLAAIRVGYLSEIANNYASMLMLDPYVQQGIARKKAEVLAPADSKTQLTSNKARLERLLWELAHERGPGTSHSARVQAASKLCNIYDMDGATKIKHDITHKGGVMLMPGIAKVDDWEKEAAQSQDKLIESSAEDRTLKPH